METTDGESPMTLSSMDRPWRGTILAVAGLLVAVAAIGVVGVVINRNIHQVVERAITVDVELEDSADDLRVAVLDVRHYHRDLLLDNPTPPTVDAWEDRYEILLERIDALQMVVAERAPDLNRAAVRDLRPAAEAYHADFREALEELPEDRQAYTQLAEDLLVPIARIEEVAEELDQTGEQRAAAAFRDIDEASGGGTLVMLAVMVGLGAVAVALAVAVLRLVGDQRRLVVAEQAAAAEQAEASRAKTNFIADASHELRTPLTVLRGNAEVGLALEDDCLHGDMLREIVEESTRMSRLVDDLLFLARSDAASVPLELRALDVSDLTAGLAARSEVLARERGARLQVKYRGHGTMRADAARIEQAVLILVDNAAKYGPPGDTVNLIMETTPTQLMIRVEDRGPGIAPELRSRIFERFYRGSDIRGRRPGGAGLGLAIAAAIVEGHGGHIDAYGRLGGGTRMEMRLPLTSLEVERTPIRVGS